MKKLRVFSTFDGIAGARIALERAGIPVEVYYASEIEKNAITIAQHNYPDIIQLGDIRNIDGTKYRGQIDLYIGGSSCTTLSMARANREEFEGESGLFYEYMRLRDEIQPTYFFLENVYGMSAEAKAEITRCTGVEPLLINSKLMSAQSRRRFYWTNIPNASIPEDKGIKLQDILEYGYADRDKSLCLLRSYARFSGTQAYLCRRYFGKYFGQAVFTSKEDRDLIKAKWKENDRFLDDELEHPIIRGLTCLECERLQTLPDNYTACVDSEPIRKKVIGNGWTIDVISHLLSGLKEAYGD